MDIEALIKLVEDKILQQENFIKTVKPVSSDQQILCDQAKLQYNWFLDKLKDCDNAQQQVKNNVVSNDEIEERAKARTTFPVTAYPNKQFEAAAESKWIEGAEWMREKMFLRRIC